MNHNIFLKVQEVFRQVFDNPGLSILSTMVPDDIDTWNSLKNMLIITALEKEFHISFELDDILEK